MTNRDVLLTNAAHGLTGVIAFLQRAGATDALLTKLLEAKRDIDRERCKPVKTRNTEAA